MTRLSPRSCFLQSDSIHSKAFNTLYSRLFNSLLVESEQEEVSLEALTVHQGLNHQARSGFPSIDMEFVSSSVSVCFPLPRQKLLTVDMIHFTVFMYVSLESDDTSFLPSVSLCRLPNQWKR